MLLKRTSQRAKTCVVLIYTATVLLVQHTGNRRWTRRTRVIVAFVVFDVIFTGLMIGIITILAHTGVPSNCAGLTRSDCKQPVGRHRTLHLLLQSV